MLVEAIADFLPMAVGAALSPIPIAGIVTVLLSARPTNAWPFLLGWILGILSVGAIVLAIPGLCPERGESTPVAGWIRVVLGSILLLLAAKKWRHRPSSADPIEVPKVLAAMESMNSVRSCVIGFSLAAVNPKNLALTIAAAASIDGAMTVAQRSAALAIYTAIASASIAIPIAAYLFFPAKIKSSLGPWKDWLIRNNSTVVAMLLTVLGSLIFGYGLKILAA